MRKGARFFLALFLLFSFGSLWALDFDNGEIRLTLHERDGRFSLYQKPEYSNGAYEALFTDSDPRTSFLQVIVNDISYKLGDTSTFKIRIEENSGNPAFVFESPFLKVTEEFAFIKTAGVSYVNGLAITITLANKSEKTFEAGARILIDTSLGEQGAGPDFVTDSYPIAAETFIDAEKDRAFWISENDHLSLMGSISVVGIERPSGIHFANWKRLNEVSWKAPYSAGRNFNAPPYSIKDSAVCYYFDPRPLPGGQSCSFTFFLASGDKQGFLPQGQEKAKAPPDILDDEREKDLLQIRNLINRIDVLMTEGNASGEEINALEQTLNQLLAKYGSGSVNQR
ncbi:MAG: hypothetical protein LBF78_07145 [Treponema sp.]|jgi:hypothetical protein|nr:hypothetical protein [Treponema sp.]